MPSGIPPAEGSAPRVLLGDYNSDEDGPLFAVSDEGSAGAAVVEAAYASAKAAAVVEAATSSLRLGVILDGERMTSAGETPIGPPEYRALTAAAAGRLLLTTNVGTRVNVRLSGQLPEFAADASSLDAIAAAFQPFLHTPDGRARTLTARLRVAPDADVDDLRRLMEKIEEQREQGLIGPAELHRFSLLLVFEEPIQTDPQLAGIEAIIAAASDLKISEVAIDGQPLAYSRRRLSAAGLLNILDIENLNRLLRFSVARGVRLVGRYQFDMEATARTIWTGLETARTHGFDGGKYGLFPLTLEEQERVIGLVTRWTAGWTAIPAFYVDTPLVTATEVYDIDRCEAAARRWLKSARGAGATIALFDAPDRVSPRKLVKSEESPDGVLTPDEIEQLSRFGELLGIRIMWSGGITAKQALELAKRRVFAIFSTSSTASKVAVTAAFEGDPRLASENEPQELGVKRMHAIIQAGFLSTHFGSSQPDTARGLEEAADRLLDGQLDGSGVETALTNLNELLFAAWKDLRSSALAAAPKSQLREQRPVPPDAVRVFRGHKHVGTTHEMFVQRLERLFMPMTVQMQRLYGLAAYLPAVLPESDEESLPDEVALVFYQTQESYHEAKRCIGGRAYSELHELAFDMEASGSGFPSLLEANEIQANQPYYLFERSVDWQAGSARFFAGRRKVELSASEFLTQIGATVGRVRADAKSLDGAIFLASEEMLLWWDHSSVKTTEPVNYFEKLADPIYAAAPRGVRISTDLTEPFAGLSIQRAGDFLNFQFPRL